jgi:hypothetical protein
LNVLKSHLRITIQTLLSCGKSQREIERVTGVDRKTIRRYAQPAQESGPSKAPGVATGFSAGEPGVLPVQTPPPRPPAPVPKEARSACEVHRDWITDQVQLGRNAQSIYQDLVERHVSVCRWPS